MPEFAQVINSNTVVDPDDDLYYFDENDSAINAGTMFLVDLRRARSFPAQATPANGARIKDMITGNDVATVVKTASHITFTDGGLAIDGTVGNYIKMGWASANTDDFLLNPLGVHEFAAFVWYKQTAYGGSYGPAMARSRTNYTTAAALEFSINADADGQGIIAVVSNGTSTFYASLPNGAPKDYWHSVLGQFNLVGMALVGNKIRIYVNDRMLWQGTGSDFSGNIKNYTGIPIQLGEGLSGNNLPATFKRWGIHKLGYGLTPEEIFTNEYLANFDEINS